MQAPQQQTPPVIDPTIQQILGQPQTNNGQPDGTPTAEQVRANRINVMRAQMEETNTPFDPQTGVAVPDMATANQQQQQPPVPATPPQMQQTPPVTQQQPPVTPTPPQVSVPPAQQPAQQGQQQQPPVQQQQPPVQTGDPNQQQQQLDPNAQQQQQLTPEQQEELRITQRLDALMGEQQQGQQPQDATQQAILQNQQLLLSLFANQNPALAAQMQMPMMQAPQPQAFQPPVSAVAPPPQQVGVDPFSWDAPQNQMPVPVQPTFQQPMAAPTDPNQMLFGQAINQLSQQINQMQQTNQQVLHTQRRERDIQNLMTANGISRQHAERAQDYFEQGNFQAGSEVVNLASAPVIAKKLAAEERDIRRDAAGQPLTPAPQGGVFQTPNEIQAKTIEWANIQSMPNSENKRLAIIGFIQRNPELAATAQPGSLQTQAVT